MLCNFVTVVPVHPQAIPLPMITMTKSIHGFCFFSYMSMVLGYNENSTLLIFLQFLYKWLVIGQLFLLL